METDSMYPGKTRDQPPRVSVVVIGKRKRSKSVDMFSNQLAKIKKRQLKKRKEQIERSTTILYYSLITYHMLYIIFTNFMAVEIMTNLSGLITVTLVWMFVVMSIHLMGIIGAAARNRELLLAYATALCMIVIINCILVFVASYTINGETVSFKYKTLLINRYTGQFPDRNKDVRFLDMYQVEWKCCGISSYLEYQKARYWSRVKNETIPKTCCVISDRQLYKFHNILMVLHSSCTTHPSFSNSYVHQPCKPFITKETDLNRTLYYICVAVPLILQVIIFVLTVYLRDIFNGGIHRKTDSQTYLKSKKRALSSTTSFKARQSTASRL